MLVLVDGKLDEKAEVFDGNALGDNGVVEHSIEVHSTSVN